MVAACVLLSRNFLVFPERLGRSSRPATLGGDSSPGAFGGPGGAAAGRLYGSGENGPTGVRGRLAGGRAEGRWGDLMPCGRGAAASLSPLRPSPFTRHICRSERILPLHPGYYGAMNIRRCEHCDERLGVRHAHNARYCSGRCRTAAHRARRTIPTELTTRPRWVRRTSRKVPITAGGDAASSTDPATWSRYRDAAASSTGAGLGFVLDGDGVVCLDLDHCVTGGDQVAGWARNILDAVDGSTWVEMSASGDGLHVWGYGDLPHGRRITVGGGSVELYGTGRYIAVTGQAFNDTPRRLADIQHVIDQLI